MLPWLSTIDPPTVLYCPLKLRPPVFCTLMVMERAVIGVVLLNLMPSSSKKGPFELITVANVTPPFPDTAGFTARLMVTAWVRVPLVPVTVTFAVPVVALLEAVNVSVLVVVVDAGLNAAVTPAGSPLIANATLPIKPPLGVTVMASVAVAP